MSSSKGCLVSSSSPSGWSWWPATVALASGGRPEQAGSRTTPASVSRQRHCHPTRASPSTGHLALPVQAGSGRYGGGEHRGKERGPFGIGERDELVASPQGGGALDRDELAVADHQADPHVLAQLQLADPMPVGRGARHHQI